MNSIFDNARLGDIFVRRDGIRMTYIGPDVDEGCTVLEEDGTYKEWHYLAIEGNGKAYPYDNLGHYRDRNYVRISDNTCGSDIASKESGWKRCTESDHGDESGNYCTLVRVPDEDSKTGWHVYTIDTLPIGWSKLIREGGEMMNVKM